MWASPASSYMVLVCHNNRFTGGEALSLRDIEGCPNVPCTASSEDRGEEAPGSSAAWLLGPIPPAPRIQSRSAESPGWGPRSQAPLFPRWKGPDGKVRPVPQETGLMAAARETLPN